MNTATAQNGKYAMINGLHMYYEIHGAGKPLVLIHGAASTLGIFPGGHGNYIGELATLETAHNPSVAMPLIADFFKMNLVVNNKV